MAPEIATALVNESAKAATAAAGTVPVGMIILLALAWLVPMGILIGIFYGIVRWAQGRMKLHRIMYIEKNGEVSLADYNPNDKKNRNPTIGDSRHIFRAGKPQRFLVSWFGWRQPLHIFHEGVAMEAELNEGKLNYGSDLNNSELLKAHVESERWKRLLAGSAGMGYSLMLIIMGFCAGALVAVIITSVFGPKAPPAIAANSTVTTILQGAVKR